MEQLCKNGYCKRKLNEYRELTSKQYDDIDTLENDIKDKDAFVQTLVKARNDYQKEVVLLKNSEITWWGYWYWIKFIKKLSGKGKKTEERIRRV